MKRIVLSLIPLVLSLFSCSKQQVNPEPEDEVIPNQVTVNQIKNLLSKQDLSEFYTKRLQGTYTQEYDVLDIDKDEDTKVSNYFNYGGYGIFGFYYDLEKDEYDSIVDEKGNIDTFDAIATGTGSYGIVQLARSTSFSREDSWESKVSNLDILQQITLKTTKQDVWVDNSLDVTETGIFDGSATQRFKASIDKELLFGSVSKRTFRDIFSKVDLFDTPGNVEHLDKLYYSLCRELLSRNDKGISDFILMNQFSIKEEDNIEVSFVFDTDDIEGEEADYIFPGVIKGTLIFDKETYEFSNFSYEVTCKAETYDENSGSVKLVNTKFTCEGVSTHKLPEDPWEPIDPVVYSDVSEFLKDVNEQVIPPEIHL